MGKTESKEVDSRADKPDLGEFESRSRTENSDVGLTAKVQKSETVHGTVYYSVVTCDSCGTEVKRDDAHIFVIGDLQEQKDWSSRVSLSFDTDDDVRVGWACEYCAETSPVSFPERVWKKNPDILMVILALIGWLLILGLTAVSVI